MSQLCRSPENRRRERRPKGGATSDAIATAASRTIWLRSAAAVTGAEAFFELPCCKFISERQLRGCSFEFWSKRVTRVTGVRE